MKVLWFTNTPGSGDEFLKTKVIGGGWLKSLDREISKHVELGVAFYYSKPAVNFKHNNINFFPITNIDWKWQTIKGMVFPSFVDEEDLQRYVSIIEDFKPDIIHIHGTENPFACIISKVNIPVVVSIQGNITVYYEKYCSGIPEKYLFKNFYFFKTLKMFPFFQNFKKGYKLFFKMKEREIKNMQKTRFVIGRTRWDKRVAKVLAPNSCYYHNDEILRDIFYTTKWVSPQNTKIIIHTTNGNSPFKGFEIICQTLEILNDLNFEIEWRVAGINEDDLIVKVTKKYLGKQFPKKGLKLLGALTEDQLVDKLLETNIYVMPSHIENSPNNLCEAMIIGMPCIASFAGGTESLLENEKEGILVQDGDQWALAGSIIELVENPVRAFELGVNARKRALERHSKEKIVKELLEIYKTM